MKRILHSVSCATLLLALVSAAHAQVVSFHFFGANIYQPAPQMMAPTEVAGVRAVANWNNLMGASSNATPVALVDSAGAASGLSVDWDGPNTWACYYGDSAGNRRMMRSYLDSADVIPSTVVLHGLNAAKNYLVYVYVGPADLNDKGIYTVGSQTFSLTNPTQFDGVTFTQVTSTDVNNPGAGNYMIFNVTGQADVTLTAQTNTALGGYRAPINALQIVAINPAGKPTNLAASAGDKRVTLYWTGDANADTYSVKRSSSASGPFTEIGTPSATTFTDTTASNGATYYYQVTSVNALGASQPSNVASAAAQTGSDGTGLSAAYFTAGANVGTPNFVFDANTPTLTQIDPTVFLDVDGNNGSLPPASIPHDNFSVRWAAAVKIPISGDYVFATASDDGTRLYLDGQLIVDNYNFQPVTTVDSAPITLTAGSKHLLTCLFFQGTGGGEAHLYWKVPGQTPQTIPQYALFPGAVVMGNIALDAVNDLSATDPAAPLGNIAIQFRVPNTMTVVNSGSVTLTTAAGSANGHFDIGGLPAGTYDVWIKGGKNLAVLTPNVAVSGTTIALPDSLLGAGDSDNNNTVDVLDFGNLVNAYGSKASDPNSGYDPNVDFDFNGAVDVLDFGDLVNNYGTVGPK